jgi:hypothetical protein
MKKLFSLFAFSILMIALVPSVALAAKPPTGASGGKPQPAPVEQVGYDISYPQCSIKRLPTGQYFGIVGVNGGTAATTNPCLATQLAWANGSLTGSKQPTVQLYVNTANPAGDSSYSWATWPTSNFDKTGYDTTTTNPYGVCSGSHTNNSACSWQYGWNRSVEANLDRFVPAAKTAKINTSAGAYTWWLDVETGNSWQAGPDTALAHNTATLEGMTAYYKAQGAQVGLYSTAVQWSTIVGSTVTSASNLNGLANWRPSGSSLSNAKTNCSVAPLTTGGIISITQYVVSNLDNNHSCL